MTNHKLSITAFLAAVLLASVSASARVRPVKQREEVIKSAVVITGTIDRFIDGDSYWLKFKDGHEAKFREWVEDAPETPHNSKEIAQPFGAEALKYCTDHWKGKRVTATVKGKSYDRLVVQTVPSGETRAIGLVMVSVGLAQVYPKSTPRPPAAYVDAETAAKEKKLGVWSTDSAIAPWDWRKQSRNQKGK